MRRLSSPFGSPEINTWDQLLALSGRLNTFTGINVSSFSADDGFWAFSIGNCIEGDSGPTYKDATGFGFGNFNSGDASSDLYWNGSLVSGIGYVGLLFCDDLG